MESDVCLELSTLLFEGSFGKDTWEDGLETVEA